MNDFPGYLCMIWRMEFHFYSLYQTTYKERMNLLDWQYELDSRVLVKYLSRIKQSSYDYLHMVVGICIHKTQIFGDIINGSIRRQIAEFPKVSKVDLILEILYWNKYNENFIRDLIIQTICKDQKFKNKNIKTSIFIKLRINFENCFTLRIMTFVMFYKRIEVVKCVSINWSANKDKFNFWNDSAFLYSTYDSIVLSNDLVWLKVINRWIYWC